MLEAIVCIAAGVAIGYSIAAALLCTVMFSKKGCKWMYRKSKNIVDTMMEEETKRLKKEEDEMEKAAAEYVPAWWNED